MFDEFGIPVDPDFADRIRSRADGFGPEENNRKIHAAARRTGPYGAYTVPRTRHRIIETNIIIVDIVRRRVRAEPDVNNFPCG